MVSGVPLVSTSANNLGFWTPSLGRSFSAESLIPTISSIRSSLRVGGVPHLQL
jgi:hypothetical protein